MPILPNADFNQLRDWLNENLTNSFRPHMDEIPDIKSKGIYFWFMKQEGYNQLSKYVAIKPIDACYTKEIDGVKYDLVYLGTAGVRNNSSGINNGHLVERLMWHLTKNKDKSALKSGTMSTFRRTIGALIEDDLLDNNTQQILDNFFRDSFVIFYIEYPGSFSEVKDIVNQDETKLIEVVRPIFNLDKNPNAKITDHITYLIQERRQLIEKSSISKLGIIEKKVIPQKNKSKAIVQINECVEFKVRRNQNILVEVGGIQGLPDEACTFEILNSANGLRLSPFENWNKTGTKVHINPNAQNIYTYFAAQGKINGAVDHRWLHIQNRMNNPNDIIEEITVRVCPIIKK